MGLGFRRDDEERAVTKGYVKKAGFLVPHLMYTFEAI
jgi:hypothetical protein